MAPTVLFWPILLRNARRCADCGAKGNILLFAGWPWFSNLGAEGTRGHLQNCGASTNLRSLRDPGSRTGATRDSTKRSTHADGPRRDNAARSSDVPCPTLTRNRMERRPAAQHWQSQWHTSSARFATLPGRSAWTSYAVCPRRRHKWASRLAAPMPRRIIAEGSGTAVTAKPLKPVTVKLA